jgi:chromosome segregation ATPase
MVGNQHHSEKTSRSVEEEFMGNQLKRLHDQLLEAKPEEALHDEQQCELCAESFDNQGVSVDDQPEGGSMSEDAKTYSEDDLKAAVEKAVSDVKSELQSKLSELEDSKQQSDIDKAVADAIASSDESIKELQAKLDAAVLEAETERKSREELEASIETERKQVEEAAALEVKKTERIEAVKEVASFPDDYLTENSERWALMADDEFAKSIEDWKVIAAKSDDNTEAPTKTAMTASREEGGKSTESSLGLLGELRRELVGKSL